MSDEFLKNTFNLFKYIVIFSIVEFVCLFLFLTKFFSSYDKNVFEIVMNQKDIKCYYEEKYNLGFFEIASSEGYNSVDTEINELELEEIIKLSINEYEEFYNNGYKKNDNFNWFFHDNMKYVQVKNNVKRVVIYRMNNVIYDGVPLENYYDIVGSKGRYYFHIYSERKLNLISTVKTHISFNVIIGGGNHDSED